MNTTVNNFNSQEVVNFATGAIQKSEKAQLEGKREKILRKALDAVNQELQGDTERLGDAAKFFTQNPFSSNFWNGKWKKLPSEKRQAHDEIKADQSAIKQ